MSKNPKEEIFYLKAEFNNILNEPDAGDVFTMLTVVAAIGIAYINTLDKTYNFFIIYYIWLCLVLLGFILVAYQRHRRGIKMNFIKICIYVLNTYEFKIPGNKSNEKSE